MKHKIEFIYRETCSGSQDRYLPAKLVTCALPVLNRLVRLSWDDDQSGPVQVQIGDLFAGAFAFHKDVQLSVDGKPLPLTDVWKGVSNLPEWHFIISRRLSAGVFVVPPGGIYTDPHDALHEYLSRCKRENERDVRLPDGTLLPIE